MTVEENLLRLQCGLTDAFVRMDDCDRATNTRFRSEKPRRATGKSLIVLNLWLTLNQPLCRKFQMLASRHSHARWRELRSFIAAPSRKLA